MTSNTVVIFGAGATKACGGPLTNEILPMAFEPAVRPIIEREFYIDLLDQFLVENFFVPARQADRTDADYPALPLLMSLIDKAIDLEHPMGPTWALERLRQVRRALQYLIFALLEYKLRRLDRNYYSELLKVMDPTRSAPPTIISLNYDIIIDNAMVEYRDLLPDYCCDISTQRYVDQPHGGSLLKVHGSLNWSYCPNCKRLDLGVAASGQTYKMLADLYQANPLEARYACHGFPCTDCGTFVEPILITPSQDKDYRNDHVTKVWVRAEQALRKADRVIIIGYSLPDDDLDVVYLLKRGLGKLASTAPGNITVVERAAGDAGQTIARHPVGRRYRAIFGPDIDWRTDGFEGLLAAPAGIGTSSAPAS